MTPAEEAGRLVALRSGRSAHSLFVREEGPPSAPPLLFLHGFPTSSLDWAKIASAFPDRRRLLPDLLGFGRSDKPAIRYSYALQADLVSDLLATCGVAGVDDRRRHGPVWEAAMIAAADRTAFVWGPADPVSGEHVLREVKARMPAARTTSLAGVGHYPHWEAPERTTEAIAQALERAA